MGIYVGWDTRRAKLDLAEDQLGADGCLHVMTEGPGMTWSKWSGETTTRAECKQPTISIAVALAHDQRSPPKLTTTVVLPKDGPSRDI
jgi:hypothetical protein